MGGRQRLVGTRRPRARVARCGFTLVELLVVIAIIGVLVALLLPAIQAAREAARRAQCKNNIKQLALASLNYESANRFMPAGGWGFVWMGDPDLGAGKNQPGGWIFGLLPYIEQGNLLTIGKGLPLAQKKIALGKQMAVVIPFFNCPSRRAAVAYPALNPSTGKSPDDPLNNVDTASVPALVAKTDYAINGGHNNIGIARSNSAPPGCDDLRNPGYAQTTANSCGGWLRDAENALASDAYTGISATRSQTQLRQVLDGTSNTVLIGEKYLEQQNYESGIGDDQAKHDPGDNSAMYQGYDWDQTRFGAFPPMQDVLNEFNRSNDNAQQKAFGGPHTGGANISYCDGSVHTISFDIDPAVFSSRTNRNDGKDSSD